MTTEDRRLKLSAILHDILGTDEVYFEPSESIRMKYPAIVYERSDIVIKHADNVPYLRNDKYSITFIRKDADNPILDKLLTLQHCKYDRPFKQNGLYHDIFTIYI